MTERKRSEVARGVRQRLESLKRAGVDRIPKPTAPTGRRRKAEAVEPAPAPEPAAPTPAAPASPPPRPRPARPAEPISLPIATPSLFASVGLEGPDLPREQRIERLRQLDTVVSGCPRCPVLVENRTRTVFGTGDPMARLMFIGEAPGADEDRRGEPFVGRAGQLLTDMITKGMGLRREDVYIANILKCRPPNNRDPLPDEVANCIGYLQEQIEIVRPSYLCLLGRISAQTLLGTSLPMSRLRGKWHEYRGVATMVTYHPAALLRNPAWKKDTWEDLKMLMRAMGLKPPESRKEKEKE